MSDQEISQHQETHPPSANAKANGSGPSGKVEPIERPSDNRSTGPRTALGKQRSKFNALKHGFLSKAVLLKDESPAEYQALLNGLRKDYEPEGTLENLLVENLAILWWRRRRFLQVETAEISKKNFLELDSCFTAETQSIGYEARGEGTDGRMGGSNNLVIIRKALDRLKSVHFILSGNPIDEQHAEALKKFLGLGQDRKDEGRFSILFHEVLELHAYSVKANEQTDDPELPFKFLCQAIKSKMDELSELHTLIIMEEAKKIGTYIAAAGIPSQEVSDRLLRYESQLSRELDRTLIQLERLQRMRKGQPVPRLDISLSA